ncbi:MAG: hypothetical protein PHT07_15035 [Paludibacter sp.]|nr:hypothetical protein [Paludibacter sp.]
MRKIIRKIIVRGCALHYRIGKGNIPRIAVNATALFFISVAINISSNTLGTMNWYDWIFDFIFVLLAWIGFDWLGAGYFEIWPIKFEELSDFQKYTFSRVKFHELTVDQVKELKKIILSHPEWFSDEKTKKI